MRAGLGATAVADVGEPSEWLIAVKFFVKHHVIMTLMSQLSISLFLVVCRSS